MIPGQFTMPQVNLDNFEGAATILLRVIVVYTQFYFIACKDLHRFAAVFLL